MYSRLFFVMCWFLCMVSCVMWLLIGDVMCMMLVLIDVLLVDG